MVAVVVAVVVVVGVAVAVAVAVVVGVAVVAAVGVAVMTANHSRRKGVRGEAELTAIWRRHGFGVQLLQNNAGGLGDHLVTVPLIHTETGFAVPRADLYVESKRCERLRIPEWIEQVEAIAGTTGYLPVLGFRQSQRPWYVVMEAERFAGLFA